MDAKTGETRIRTTDINSEIYQTARRYLVRLNPEDMEGENLTRLAKTAKISPEEFKKRFDEI